MRNGKVVVYIPVAGDLFHIGHRRILKQARKLGDIVIAGVVTDESLEKYKRKPIIPYAERATIIGDYVDEVVSQNGQDPIENLKADSSIDILIHGNDWPLDYPAFVYMRSIGKKAVQIKYYKSQSTTKIIATILERHG